MHLPVISLQIILSWGHEASHGSCISTAPISHHFATQRERERERARACLKDLWIRVPSIYNPTHSIFCSFAGWCYSKCGYMNDRMTGGLLNEGLRANWSHHLHSTINQLPICNPERGRELVWGICGLEFPTFIILLMQDFVPLLGGVIWNEYGWMNDMLTGGLLNGGLRAKLKSPPTKYHQPHNLKTWINLIVTAVADSFATGQNPVQRGFFFFFWRICHACTLPIKHLPSWFWLPPHQSEHHLRERRWGREWGWESKKQNPYIHVKYSNNIIVGLILSLYQLWDLGFKGCLTLITLANTYPSFKSAASGSLHLSVKSILRFWLKDIQVSSNILLVTPTKCTQWREEGLSTQSWAGAIGESRRRWRSHWDFVSLMHQNIDRKPTLPFPPVFWIEKVHFFQSIGN